MRLVVEPLELSSTARAALDLSAQVGSLDTAPVGRLVSAGAPDSTSALGALELAARLAQELSVLAAELTAHATALAVAADGYASAEQSIAGRMVGHP